MHGLKRAAKLAICGLEVALLCPREDFLDGLCHALVDRRFARSRCLLVNVLRLGAQDALTVV